MPTLTLPEPDPILVRGKYFNKKLRNYHMAHALPFGPGAVKLAQDQGGGEAGARFFQAAWTIISIVVSVVFYWLGGSVWGSALMSAAMNFVNQVEANKAGLQEGINWGSVAVAGISSFVSGAMGVGGAADLTSISGIVTALGRNLLTGAITEGISVATGLQESLNWANVAESL